GDGEVGALGGGVAGPWAGEGIALEGGPGSPEAAAGSPPGEPDTGPEAAPGRGAAPSGSRPAGPEPQGPAAPGGRSALPAQRTPCDRGEARVPSESPEGCLPAPSVDLTQRPLLPLAPHSPLSAPTPQPTLPAASNSQRRVRAVQKIVISTVRTYDLVIESSHESHRLGSPARCPSANRVPLVPSRHAPGSGGAGELPQRARRSGCGDIGAQR